MDIEKKLNSLKKFDKNERSSFSYWYNHWLAYNLVALKQHAWKLKYAFHDWYKPWLRLFLPYEKVQSFHRSHSNHHPEWLERKLIKAGKKYKKNPMKWVDGYLDAFHKYDYKGTIIDWECSRYTKNAANLNAHDEYNKVLNYETFITKYPHIGEGFNYFSKKLFEAIKELNLENYDRKN